MEKNILQEITNIQQTKCVDINLINATIQLNTTFTTQSLGVPADFYKDKKVTIGILIPVGVYEILSNTSTDIVIDYEDISFKLVQVQPAPPTPPLPDILFNSTMQFKITFDDININDNILVQDRKIVLNSPVICSVEFTILSNTTNSITLYNTDPSIFLVDVVGITLQRSLEFESMLNSFKSLLNTTNDRQLTRFECPTNNSFFAKYDIFSDIMIGYKNTYKIEDKMNDIIGLLNGMLSIDISGYSTKFELEPYYMNVQDKIALIYNTIDDWTAYFERLKKLMSKMRISDAMVEEENCQNLYDAKPLASQQVIDAMYNTYVVLGREGYTDYKQELMFDIKID